MVRRRFKVVVATLETGAARLRRLENIVLCETFRVELDAALVAPEALGIRCRTVWARRDRSVAE